MPVDMGQRLRAVALLFLLFLALFTAAVWHVLGRLAKSQRKPVPQPSAALPTAPQASASLPAESETRASASETGSALTRVPHGTMQMLQGYRVLHLEGTPAQMGTAAGTLLRPIIQRLHRALFTNGMGKDAAARRNLLAGSAVMAKHQPPAYLEELDAMAQAVGIKREELYLLQYHGDVRRCITGPGAGHMCTSFAVLPPNTRHDVCIVGRNLDYFDEGVSEYATVLIHYRPQGKIPFVTVTWAGIINGWSLLSEKGIFVSNNTAFGAQDESLEGIATCFLLRHVVEHARSVAEAVALVERGPRACGTNMLIASGTPPDAVLIEYDHARVAVRRPQNGFVGAANSFQVLYQETPDAASPQVGRCGTAWDRVRQYRGRVDFGLEIAGAEGVPIPSMNLHCATVDVTHLRLRLAMGAIPAFRLPMKTFRLTPAGLQPDSISAAGESR